MGYNFPLFIKYIDKVAQKQVRNLLASMHCVPYEEALASFIKSSIDHNFQCRFYRIVMPYLIIEIFILNKTNITTEK